MVLCQLFTFSVMWNGRPSQIRLFCLYFLSWCWLRIRRRIVFVYPRFPYRGHNIWNSLLQRRVFRYLLDQFLKDVTVSSFCWYLVVSKRILRSRSKTQHLYVKLFFSLLEQDDCFSQQLKLAKLKCQPIENDPQIPSLRQSTLITGSIDGCECFLKLVTESGTEIKEGA